MNTSVRGADRALMIFEAFEAVKRQLTLREIAAHCGLPVSSAHALVQTLLSRGYLYTVGRRKELYPNRRIFTLAKTIVEHDPVLARLFGDLEALRDECGETVVVAKRHGDLLQYLHTVDSQRPIRYVAARPGEFRPLHSTANGKALLSLMSEGELNRWLDDNPLKAVTSKTITSRQRLLKDIEAGRKRGYFIVLGEHSEDSEAIAVPVLLHNNAITICLAGPANRMQPATAKFGARLLALKKKLEGAMAQPSPRKVAVAA